MDGLPVRQPLRAEARHLFLSRLFNVAPGTTARFSRFDDRSRSPSPPCRYPKWLAYLANDPILVPCQRLCVVADQGPFLFAFLAASLSASRAASRSAMAWRLSQVRRPRASASSTLALPSRK